MGARYFVLKSWKRDQVYPLLLFKYSRVYHISRVRSYHGEYTGSRPITEVKLHRACLVLGWVTARESQVPNTFFSSSLFLFEHAQNQTLVFHINSYSKLREISGIYTYILKPVF